MSEASKIWLRKMFGEPLKRISSQELEFGRTRSGSQVGPTSFRSSRVAARVNRGLRRVKERASKTSVTSGPTGSSSSEPVVPQSSLVSRYQALTAFSGSTLFSLTWKQRATPAKRWISVQRASARRTSDSDSTGWPTPKSSDGPRGGMAERAVSETRRGSNLNDTVMLVSWSTPTAQDSRGAARHTTSTGVMHPGTTLFDAARMTGWSTPLASDGDKAQLASWATPQARDVKGSPLHGPQDRGTKGPPLNEQVRLVGSGPMPTGSTAATGSTGQLNPELSRWLQGLPVEWARSRPTETGSRRSSQRRSSEVSSKQRSTDR